ncbi:MAG: GntR family transcriptional regulator [Lachnospiraceae bacterium]|nr:GntR family transcriptional regulator [Lachnospiraceae bacterium]
MNIIISNSSDLPIYEQIARQIKSMITGGELKAGDALPSMRTLAKDLKISLITTKRAYEELERDGFIESYTGKGSFVCQGNIDLLWEESLKRIEEHLHEAVLAGAIAGTNLSELVEMLTLIYNEENETP